MNTIKRGDIILVDLEPVKGSEQGKVRPVVVIQNDYSNTLSPVIIVAAITGKQKKHYFTDVFLPTGSVSGLSKDSIILGNQIRTIDKERVIRHLGSLPEKYLTELGQALKISLHLLDY